ncbi:MAG: RagB/SusD family nutrient uptake outer membrane protein, partial [Ginsengibacter sp.]
MKNNISKWLLVITVIVALYACKKSFLEAKPNGVLDEATLSTESGINKLLIGAYAMLDGNDGSLGIGGQWGSGASNFVFGSMAGGEANRGSTPGDQGPNMTPPIRHEAAPNSQGYNDRWKALYEGIKRTNTVLELLAKTTVSEDVNKNLAGQARLLRAWYHFQARITFGKVPFMDEATDIDLSLNNIQGVSNQDEILPKILADAKYAYENLPASQDAKARINKWCAGAVYGKILMFSKDFATAKTVLNDVIANGTTPKGVHYDLNANYGDNFNVDFENSKEDIFSFQSSAQDNAGAQNGNWGDNLNQPAFVGGAGFFCPTYFFTNKFKTDALGLPVANPQDNAVMDPAGQAGLVQYAGNVDPRLDWTVGRNGVPFHDWGIVINSAGVVTDSAFHTSWQRDVSAGPFATKKVIIRKSQVAAVHDASVWFSSGGT